jgi:twitching motility protein PilT
MNLRQMLVEMLSKGASDLHLRVGIKPTMRVDGVLTPINTPAMTKEGMSDVLNQILNPEQQKRFITRNEMDLALSVAKLGRFRINLFRQRGTIGIALRAVNTTVPTFDELSLPPVIQTIAENRRGLVIVTGTTGSGKSTTLASMIEHINSTRKDNVLTVEDPIEYIYRDKECIISQREVGGDTPSFGSALKHAFRQDPDTILIGEIRDADTMSTALAAADTGHFVLTTLHTMNAIETISRIISFFPPHQHGQIRLLLAGTLKSIVCQRLLVRHDRPGRVPAVEVMIGTASMKECLINPEKTMDIMELIESGSIQYGMQSFDQSIMKLYRQGIISHEEAMTQASNPEDFDLRLKGITGASDRGWTEYERSEGFK